MNRPLCEFFFDFGSPTAYLAWTQLPGICAAAGADLAYRPMLLGGVFQATGNASPVAVPAKGKYMLEDMARFARRYGVPMTFNPYFPVNTLQLMRGAVGVQSQMPERFVDYVTAVYESTWVEARNMGDLATVAEVLERAGLDARAVLDLASDPAVKQALKDNTEEAVRRGAFGAPTMFVGQAMFFGQDRLDFVREALVET
jgi:2-hydroxychromene-2-carboxylate isomerase